MSDDRFRASLLTDRYYALPRCCARSSTRA